MMMLLAKWPIMISSRPATLRSCYCSVLEGGDVLAKGAVNISVVGGVLTPERARAMSSRGREGIDPAGATGVPPPPGAVVALQPAQPASTLRAREKTAD